MLSSGINGPESTKFRPSETAGLGSLLHRPARSARNGGEIARNRFRQHLLGAARNDAIDVVAVDPVESKRRERRRNAFDLARGERDQIRIAAHEAQELAVGRDGGDVGGEQRAAAVRALRPVQHGAARKMTAAANERYAR